MVNKSDYQDSIITTTTINNVIVNKEPSIMQYNAIISLRETLCSEMTFDINDAFSIQRTAIPVENIEKLCGNSHLTKEELMQVVSDMENIKFQYTGTDPRSGNKIIITECLITGMYKDALSGNIKGLTVNPSLIPYLIYKKIGYYQFDPNIAKKLTTIIGKRLYELICQYQTQQLFLRFDLNLFKQICWIDPGMPLNKLKQQLKNGVNDINKYCPEFKITEYYTIHCGPKDTTKKKQAHNTVVIKFTTTNIKALANVQQRKESKFISTKLIFKTAGITKQFDSLWQLITDEKKDIIQNKCSAWVDMYKKKDPKVFKEGCNAKTINVWRHQLCLLLQHECNLDFYDFFD